MRTTLVLGAAAVLAAAMTSSSFAATITFDSGTLADNFAENFNSGGATSRYAVSPTIGLGGTGGVNVVAGDDSTAVLTTESFDLANGAVTVSTFFQKKTATNTGSSATLQIGLAGSTAARFNGYNDTAVTDDAFVSIRLRPNGADGLAIQGQSKLGTTDATVTPTATGNLATPTGNWYQYVVTFEKLTANQIRVTGNVFASDSSGVVTGGSLLSGTETLTNADIFGDSTLFAGFRAFDDAGNDAIDNFSVSQVPEPTSLVALGLVAVGGLARRRRA